MDESRFSSWKYRHAGRGSRSRAQKLLAAALLFGSLLALSEPPLAIFLGIVGLVALFAGSKKLFVGPRYLLCGSEIVYFANVDRVDRDEIAGTLRLSVADGRSFVLERDKFPSNARKEDKIRRNQAAKFAKAAEQVVGRIRAANPAAVIEYHG